MMRKNLMHRYLCVFAVQCPCIKFYAKLGTCPMSGVKGRRRDALPHFKQALLLPDLFP